MTPWERAISAQIDDTLDQLATAQTQLDHLPAGIAGRANLIDRVGELTRKLDMLLAQGEVEGDDDSGDRRVWGADHLLATGETPVDLDDVA